MPGLKALGLLTLTSLALTVYMYMNTVNPLADRFFIASLLATILYFTSFLYVRRILALEHLLGVRKTRRRVKKK